MSIWGPGKKLTDAFRWYLEARAEGQVNETYCTGYCTNDKSSLGYCDGCPKPVLLPDTMGPLSVMISSVTQLRTTATGILGFDYPAVKLVAESLGVEWDLRLVQAAESVLLDVSRRGEVD